MQFPVVKAWSLVLSVLAFLPNATRATEPGLQVEPGRENLQADETPVLRLAGLVDELLASNPELQAARKRYEAALTRPAQEGALPDPRVTAGWVSSGWPYPGAGLGSAPTSNIGVQVAQEIPFPGKRGLKSGMSRKDAEYDAQMFRATEWRLVAQLKARFHDLRLACETLDLIRRNQTLLQQLAKVAEARYAAGQAMQQDLIKANIGLSLLENRSIALEQKRLSLGAEINALLNRPPGADLGRPEPASDVPPLEPEESLEARALEVSPTLLAQRAAIDGRQLNVQLARKEYYPDLDVMSGYYNQGAMEPMWEFKVQLTVPLYFWRKQRNGLEEAGATLAAAQRTYRNEQQSVLFRLRERRLAAEAARKLMDLYAREVVPQSELALESSLASYQTGGVDFLTVLTNAAAILDYQEEYCEQRAEYLKALAGLEELAGSPPSGSGPGLSMREVPQ